jgi:hypothetical protein
MTSPTAEQQEQQQEQQQQQQEQEQPASPAADNSVSIGSDSYHAADNAVSTIQITESVRVNDKDDLDELGVTNEWRAHVQAHPEGGGDDDLDVASTASPMVLAAKMARVDLRSAITAVRADESGDAVDPTMRIAIVASQRTVYVPRMVLLVATALQLVALLFPAWVITLNYYASIAEPFRIATTAAALLCTAAALSILLKGNFAAAHLQHYMLAKILSLLFELLLFAHLSGFRTLIIFAALTSAVTCAQLVLAAAAYNRVTAYNFGTNELTYTRFSNVAAVNVQAEMTRLQRRVDEEIANAAGGGAAAAPDATQEDLEDFVYTELMEMRQEAAARVAEAEAEEEEDGSESRSRSRTPGFAPITDCLIAGSGSGSAPQRAAAGGAHFHTKEWFAANRIRVALYNQDRTGQRLTIALLLVLSTLVIGNVLYEFVKIFANQPALFSDAKNAKYNNKIATEGYFPGRTHNTWKVHVVVLDGLRNDMTANSKSDLATLFASSSFAGNSIKLKARAQLPSFSVPNWMAILSGAPPEMTGVTGNLINYETTFDHIFRQAKNYGLHAGMTGTPWWEYLVSSHLPPLDGDGTVWSDFTEENGPTYDWETANPGDDQRLKVALKAMARSAVTSPFGASGVTQLYDFFLTHFSDVDKQGHEYGVDTKWNTRDTYIGAIANKTKAIEKIIAAMDNQTMLVITSDHGHVLRGGHGGASEELLQIPVVFYTKNVSLSAAATNGFLKTDAPRFGSYENLDIVATLCALLGIPAPRQSPGIFMEEVVRAAVPASALSFHYFDLFRAKHSLMSQMMDYVGTEFYGRTTVLENANQIAAFESNGNLTDRVYCERVRDLLDAFKGQRDTFAQFVLVRNLLCSIVMLIPFSFFIYIVFQRYSVAFLTSLFDSGCPGAEANRRACGWALGTVVAHLALSTIAFIIGYFGVTGYAVWDSTIAHTPSVATTFLIRTVLAPIIIYILLTRLALFTSIRWHTLDTIRDVKARPVVTHVEVLRWISNVFGDIGIVLFGTSRFRVTAFPAAYLYLYYLAMWSAIATFVLLFMCFPVTFFIPVVFANPFFTAANSVWRFRMVTMLMLSMPLVVGTAILLWLRPVLDARTLYRWDRALVALKMNVDRHRLDGRIEALPEPAVGERVDGDEAALRARLNRRSAHLQRAMQLVAADRYRYIDTNLIESALVRNVAPVPAAAE